MLTSSGAAIVVLKQIVNYLAVVAHSSYHNHEGKPDY